MPTHDEQVSSPPSLASGHACRPGLFSSVPRGRGSFPGSLGLSELAPTRHGVAACSERDCIRSPHLPRTETVAEPRDSRERPAFNNTCTRCDQTLPPTWDTSRPLPWLCRWCEDQLVRLEAAGCDEPGEGES